MKKMLRNMFLAVLGTTIAMYLIAAPFTSIAYASEQPIVTTKSYDMDEYLNMLASTGQWERYEKFSKIASPDALAKHLAWYNGYTENTWAYDPLNLVITTADSLGFDAEHDKFTLLSQGDNKAWVRVMHQDSNYYVALERNSYGHWYVKYLYQVK